MPSTSTTKIYYVDPSATPLSTQNYTVTLNTSLTRPTTRCHFQHPAKPFRLKHPASLNTTSLAAPRTNLLKAANKNFRCCVLLKKSLVIHICCHKIYSVRENNKFPTTAITPFQGHNNNILWVAGLNKETKRQTKRRGTKWNYWHVPRNSGVRSNPESFNDGLLKNLEELTFKEIGEVIKRNIKPKKRLVIVETTRFLETRQATRWICCTIRTPIERKS